MIRNFTEAEWGYLASAVDYYSTVIDDDPGRYGPQAKPTLERAFNKARQLAPTRSGGTTQRSPQLRD